MAEVPTDRLDDVIDAAAEEPYPEVVRDVPPHERDELTVQAVDRLFERRMLEYASAAATLSEDPEPRSGIEALAGVFPTSVWVAYWSIVFGTRTNSAVRSRLLQVTDKWEQEIMRWFPRFFPEGADGQAIDAIAVQVDSLALLSTERGDSHDRQAHIDGMISFLESGHVEDSAPQSIPQPIGHRNSSWQGVSDPRGMDSVVERIISEGAATLDVADLVRDLEPVGSGSPRSSDDKRILAVGRYLLEAQADASSRAADELTPSTPRLDRLKVLCDLYLLGHGPNPFWLAFHDLSFSQRSSETWAALRGLEASLRPSIESSRRRIIGSSSNDAAVAFALHHLDGLALWSLFVPSEEALGIPANLQVVASVLFRDQG
jgi:hypothetical protein